MRSKACSCTCSNMQTLQSAGKGTTISHSGSLDANFGLWLSHEWIISGFPLPTVIIKLAFKKGVAFTQRSSTFPASTKATFRLIFLAEVCQTLLINNQILLYVNLKDILAFWEASCCDRSCINFCVSSSFKSSFKVLRLSSTSSLIYTRVGQGFTGLADSYFAHLYLRRKDIPTLQMDSWQEDGSALC